jgi:hypothetical protein
MVVVACIRRQHLHLTSDMSDVPGGLRGRNARRSNQNGGGNDRTDLTSHFESPLPFAKTAGPLEAAGPSRCIAFGSPVNMWVRLEFYIAGIAKDPFDSAKQSARRAPDLNAVCPASRLLCVFGRRDRRKTRSSRRLRGE